jgi:hypothetical protein
VDYDSIRAAGEAYRARNVTPQSPATGDPYRWDGFPRFVWDFDRPDWPVRIVSGKGCDGLILLGSMGQEPTKIEWVGAGRKFGSVVNALERGGKYHRPEIRKGDKVMIQLTSVDGNLKGPVGTLTWG